MVTRSDLEIGVRNLVAYDILEKPLSSLEGKAKRKKEKLASELAELLDIGEDGERIFAHIDRRDHAKARTLREGINVFKEQHPRYGEILEKIIAETRLEKDEVLVYGIKPGFYLGTEDYLRVMVNLGLSKEGACAMYPHLKDLSQQRGKGSETAQREILL